MLSLVSVILPVLFTAFQPLALPSLISTWPGGSVPSVTITPDLASRSAPAHSGIYSAFYDIYNGTTGAKTVSLSCSGVAGCVVDPLQITIGVGQHFDAQVTFTTGDANPSASLTLTATGQAVGSGTMALDIGPSMVQINAPGPDGSATQTVHRQRPIIRADFILGAGDATDTTSIHLSWGGVDRTSELRRNTKFLEWEVGAADTLAVGGSKSLVVTQCLISGICTTETRTIQLPNDQKPVIDFTTMPLEMTGGGFSAGFGPGVGLSGVDVETGFATPAYVSMGAGRSAGLVYSTRTSYPRALVSANIKLPWPAGTPDQLKAVLIDGGVRKDSLLVATPSCLTGSVKACRVVLQADYSSAMISGGVSRRWLLVEVSVTSSGVTKTTTDSVEVVLVDRRDSPYGSGWWPSGASRLYASGADRMLVSPSGGAVIYRGSGDSTYLSPPGSTTMLVKTASGWELQPRGTTAKAVFDANGRIVKAMDQSGNRDSIAYDGSGRVATLFDPLGKTIAFYYGAVTGKLDSVVSLPGGGGARTTRISIDTATNQLRYDSLSSPAAKPLLARYGYLTYGSVKGTAQLRARASRFGSDSVTVLYDSTTGGSNRPLQTWLLAPTSGGTVPVLSYKAAELQGWKTFRSLDSIYVEMSDPLGHWTRSRVNRWGSAELSWDAIGTLGRSSYDNVGRVLWSEGKNADSSRAYTDYDSYGRVARTYILRSGTTMLRVDSLVYDVNSRVIKRIDARGKVDSIGYDAAGRPNYHRDPSGAVTQTWYRSNGLLDSVQVPTASARRKTYYDATWSNPFRMKNEAGVTADSVLFDSYGRGVTHFGRLRVQLTSTSSNWQWHRSRLYLDVAGRADSTFSDQTLKCADPCNSPGTFVQATGSRVVRDSVGQTIQSVLIGDHTRGTSYLYDRLGRLVRMTAPSGAKDSTVYDLAGRMTSQINALNDVLQVSYDDRGRDTLTTIPRYGSVHHAYGGPQDQLTRAWVTGYADSIGGVNPNQSYVFDARGRLIADTLWTGSVARVTTHAYDTYERPVTMVNAVGTWVTKYETDRGIADTLISALGDTISIGYDGYGRVSGTSIWRGAPTPRLNSSNTFSGTGEFTASTTTVAPQGGASSYNPGSVATGYLGDGANLGVILLPTYSKQDGSGATIHTQEDSLSYDSFGRLQSWRAMTNSNLAASEDYGTDNDGNLVIAGATSVFDTTTDRLLSQQRLHGGGSWTYIYDGSGNLTQLVDSVLATQVCRWQYDYDGAGRLTTVRATKTGAGGYSTIARYAYDVTGARVARRTYSAVSSYGCYAATVGYTRYAVHGGQVQFETDSGGTILRRYIWGPGADNLLAAQVGSSTDSTFYAVKDKLGSIRGWVRKEGTWRWSMRYRPYGAGFDSTGTGLDVPYRWTGREYDPETGLYYLRARYYDPGIGRFTQQDPIGLAGGRNLYTYVDGQPLEAKDPSGLEKDFITQADYGWCSSTGGGCLTSTGSFGSGGSGTDFGVSFGAILLDQWQAWVDYDQAFKANQSSFRNDQSSLTYSDARGNLYSTTYGQVWQSAKELSKDQFGALYGMNARDPLITNALATTLENGMVGVGDFLPDMLAKAMGAEPIHVLGARAGAFVELRESDFKSDRLARIAFAHEAIHIRYPSMDEPSVCWRTEQQGFGRYNEFGLACY